MFTVWYFDRFLESWEPDGQGRYPYLDAAIFAAKLLYDSGAYGVQVKDSKYNVVKEY